MPEVDLWVTRANYAELAKLIDQAPGAPGRLFSGPPELTPDASWPRLRSTPPHRAYLRIADGCDNRCGYCVIPSLRGAYRSRPLADLAAEAELLADQGVAEVTLIAQDTTAYGHDLPERPRLSDLLRRLLRIEGPRWWRLLYAHPTRIDGELLEILAGEPRICRYLDLPLQHISRDILTRMGRPADPAATRRLIEHLRDKVPGLALRTSLIVGFPGETEADFQELRRFVAETRFNWLGIFAYSREEGTPAAALPDHLPERLKEERRADLLRLQQGISHEILAGRVGRRFPVMLERPHPERRGFWLARSESEAPEVDGLIHLRTERGTAGEFVPAEATRAGTYDLEAIPIPAPAGRSLSTGVEA